MNVVVEYPEDFPLEGADRKVFERRLRDLFAKEESHPGQTLDHLRKRIGLDSRYYSEDYRELETLFAIARTDPGDDVRRALLRRAGEYVSVRLRPALFAVPSDAGTSGPGTDDEHPSGNSSVSSSDWPDWTLIVGMVLAVILGMLVIAGIRWVFLTPRDSQPVAPATSTSTRAVPAIAPASSDASMVAPDTDMPLLPPVVDVKIDTHQPAWALAALARLAPAEKGEYLIELKVSPVFDDEPDTQTANGPGVQHSQPASGAKQ